MNAVPPAPIPAYGVLMLAGIIVSVVLWSRLAKRDERLVLIYVAGLGGAFVGAKVLYLAAEGWLHWNDPDRWIQFATGKSILGALPGGYAGVELAKRLLGFNGWTGDRFAAIAPIGILLGRVGCLLHGCCPGKVCERSWFTLTDAHGLSRWPAVPLEMLFNGAALIVFLLLRRANKLPGQHFHVYLIAYGMFRFAHEFLRDTPQIFGWISGYQIAALGVAALGIVGFVKRSRSEVRAALAAA